MTQNLINEFLAKGYLVSPDLVLNSDKLDSSFLGILDEVGAKGNKPLVINDHLLVLSKEENRKLDLNWNDFDKSRVLFEKGRDNEFYGTFLDLLSYNVSLEKKAAMDQVLESVKAPDADTVEISREDVKSNVIVLNSYNKPSKKKEMKDFVSYLKARYNSLKTLLQGRQELQNVISIGRLNRSMENQSTALIGMVSDKRITKNGNVILNLEDPSGVVNVIVSKSRQDIFEMAKEVVLDEVLGVTGMYSGEVVFVNGLHFPEVPVTKEFKKFDKDVYAVFTADMHVGSDMFLGEDFLKFVKWLNCETGSAEQKEIAKKVKYLFMVGDLVDGVGIYPNQEKELHITDIHKQYEECANLLGKIRKDINIILCGGNHDALRIAEPQPVLDKKYSSSLWNLSNVTIVSNPALVNIHSSEDFPGFDVLVYHGFSFHYFADVVDTLRLAGGSDKPELIMKFLLQKRHLAPSHTSTLYIPDVDEDPLVINKVPDFFACGHLHRLGFLNYKGVSLIGCGCWQARTSYMEKLGFHPDPSRVTLINLKTREAKILKFGDGTE